MCRLHGSPPLYAGPSHPYSPIHNPYPYISVCSGDQREIFWEMCYLLQSLESEGMGLPRDVPNGATCVGFTAAHHCALTIPTILCHTPTMHRGVKGRKRRFAADDGEPAWLPPAGGMFLHLHGTLLLVSQEIPGSVHKSLHSQPIHINYG